MHAYDGIMTKTMKFKRHFCTNWLLSEASTEEEDRTGYRSYLSRKERVKTDSELSADRQIYSS